MTREPALEAVDVTKRYDDVVALDAVSLRVPQGSCVSIVGETGSGKSTLLHCFNRVIEPDEGSVRIRGRDANGYDPYDLRRRIGFVPQDGGLLPHWSVSRNTALVPGLLGWSDGDARAGRALELVGLSESTYGARYPHELSGGQRQRVAFARAVAADPDIILLDEPFGAIDAVTRSELRQTFRRLASKLGFASLFITHDLAEAFELADTILVLRGGSVQQLAPPRELARAPANDYVQRLVRLSRIGPA